MSHHLYLFDDIWCICQKRPDLIKAFQFQFENYHSQIHLIHTHPILNMFNQSNTGGGLFSGNRNITTAGGGLFGAQQPNNNTAGGGLFGQATQPSGGGLFGGGGQPNTQSGFGIASNTNNQSFLGTQPQNTSGFGGFGNNNAGGGIFGATQQSQPPQNQGGLFGGAQKQQQQQQGGLFGQSNTGGGGLFGGGQQQQPGMFGQQQQPQQSQGAGLFGNTSGGGLFGGGGQNNNTLGGAGLFGGGNTNTTSSFFGGNQQQQQNTGGGNIFGQPVNNNNNASGGFFGQNNTNTGSVFGGNNGGAGLFGAANQQQQNTNTGGGGLFGTFASSQPATSTFGNTTSSFNFGQNQPQQNDPNANKLGGTSWGIPTPSQPNNQGQVQNFQPVRSKNSKLDQKHLVKCIAAMDQFQGCCKEEVRISFIQNGGQQPSLGQNNNTGFQKTTAFGASTPSFGATNTNSNSLFGGGQAQQFAKPTSFSPTPTPGSSLFGGSTNQPQQNTGFGNTGGTSLFGSAPNQNTSFGVQPNNNQGNSLFGGQQQQNNQGTSLFGQSPQPQNNPTSLFGTNSAPTGGFGGFGTGTPNANQGGSSLFGATAPLPAPPSLFGAPGASNPAQGQSLFGAPTSSFSPQGYSQYGTQGAAPAPQMPLSQNPYNLGYNLNSNPLNNNSAMAQMLAPLFQATPQQQQSQQQMDPSMQLLLPQLLLTAALTQPQQNQPSLTDPNTNPTLDLLNRLVTTMSLSQSNQSNPQKNINTLLNPTPFDEYLREDYSNKYSDRQFQRKSLFSEAEIKDFEDLDSRSYLDKMYQNNEPEPQYHLRHTYQAAPTRKSDPLGDNYKIISRSYKNTQEQARKKYTPTPQELPLLGQFSISPSLDRLRNMTVAQLKKVDKVKISNSFGSIEFLEPVSLYKQDLGLALKIAQDNIEIVDPELEDKKVRMTFVNFGNFRSLNSQERSKMLKKMRMWIDQFGMVEISHNTDNGELVVQTVD